VVCDQRCRERDLGMAPGGDRRSAVRIRPYQVLPDRAGEPITVASADIYRKAPEARHVVDAIASEAPPLRTTKKVNLPESRGIQRHADTYE
jgi:hypothetical protein